MKILISTYLAATLLVW